jgi:preprotein translocase subunit SecD
MRRSATSRHPASLPAHPPRGRVALVPLVVALSIGGAVLAGCSSGSDGPPDTTGPSRSTATTATTAPPTTGTSRPRPADEVASDLTFRPVLSTIPCSAEPATSDTTAPASGPAGTGPVAPTGSTVPDTTVPDPAAELVPDRAGSLCYDLGPVAADGTDLEDAGVAQLDSDPTQWTVEVTAAPAAKARFNELFNACFDGAPTCPAYEGGNGAVAVVHDGVVISAPLVSGADLADVPFTITGFTETEAKALARALAG